MRAGRFFCFLGPSFRRRFMVAMIANLGGDAIGKLAGGWRLGEVRYGGLGGNIALESDWEGFYNARHD